jgi:hypothetical protein
MLVTRKRKNQKTKKKNNKKKQCKQDISIYHEQIKGLLSSVLMTIMYRNMIQYIFLPPL